MDIKTHKAEEYRGMDAARFKESETEIRRAIFEKKMDIYGTSSSDGKTRVLRKNLARLLTVKNELERAHKASAKEGK